MLGTEEVFWLSTSWYETFRLAPEAESDEVTGAGAALFAAAAKDTRKFGISTNFCISTK